MIIVLDTNVIVSALLSPHGPPAEIIKLWEADRIEVATSPALLTELERVLAYPRIREHFEDPGNVTALLKRFRMVTTLVEPETSLDVIDRDPPDNRVLECAVAASAAYIISGDDHLLAIGDYRGIVILKSADFLLVMKQT